MEPRDAYRRPEVFAFMDARMLGAFVMPELADAIDRLNADELDETELAQLGQAIRALYAARGGPPAGARVDESEGDDDSDGDDEDSDDGDSSIEAILAEAAQRLRS